MQSKSYEITFATLIISAYYKQLSFKSSRYEDIIQIAQVSKEIMRGPCFLLQEKFPKRFQYGPKIFYKLLIMPRA